MGKVTLLLIAIISALSAPISGVLMLLKVNEPTVVDFLVLVDDSRLPTGALYWYDPLTPGVYELSMQRRLGCCDGPMIESNKISFEVVP